jgi:hypothetical protein
MEEKCLTTEAMDKCPCEFCKLMRKARDIQLGWIMKMKEIKRNDNDVLIAKSGEERKGMSSCGVT